MDFYVILGLERAAALNDIKRAYKRLARRLHPDINPGDGMAAARFRQVVEAYETLSDPDRRRRYDVEGVRIVEAGQAVAFGFDGFDFSVGVSEAGAPTFGDLFGDILRGRGPRDDELPGRGADVHETVTLTFEESIRGARRDVVVTRRRVCRRCAGSGRVATAESRCLPCQGLGTIRSARGHMVFSKTCTRCHGSGRLVDASCPACGGLRTEAHAEIVTASIPAALADGARVRVAGKGHAGPSDAGDLLLLIRVTPHPLYRRDGDDLHLVVGIGIHEAALGARVELPALDGEARLRVPPGTQSGQRFRLRGRGVPTRDGGRGDLVVEVTIQLPAVLDERSKELLREFGRINGEVVRRVRRDGREGQA